ncbi:hypothetical protein CY34DRAFT_805561 [Suillus luteus UH-Slu-Lm8-n1]|uniref:Uncharacterized protein n=1 Tax=Suillus luteus UH-Slu-Lm8-n1 TaxID=930992 RepID=A0A0D0B5X0_9AGAM|nr:hypothetical protein CY34DRAFT_805561 [Suillus luteus UH-Slu-Lm8-n1]
MTCLANTCRVLDRTPCGACKYQSRPCYANSRKPRLSRAGIRVIDQVDVPENLCCTA